ncbi:MAG: DOPA 4,5-dioxygenase family protein [Proteobacteria bacterium]|nr:DOPA 4,5-dioxygenase family protein [Pseudomonadota bacterium]
MTTPAIKAFHAHVYYHGATKEKAARLYSAVEETFDVLMGHWHDNPIGPHPMGSYQITFTPGKFGDLVPWLAFNRDGLSILIHPDTGDDIPDHTDRALWLGQKLDLDIGALR